MKLAQELQSFDEVRETAASASGRSHHDYRLWQALWASQRMQARARIPEANQGFFVFPAEPKQ